MNIIQVISIHISSVLSIATWSYTLLVHVLHLAMLIGSLLIILPVLELLVEHLSWIASLL